MRLTDAARGLLAPSFCWACGVSAQPHEPLCRTCKGRLRWLEPEAVELAGVAVWAPLAYDGPARAVVRGLKFRGALGLAEPMAAPMAAVAPPELLDGLALLVPVPLHPRRARARGFNQAERLAVALGRRTGMRVADCLRRRGPAGVHQVGRGRAERLTGIAGSVELRPGVRAPAQALLVDDVVTTGATLAACAAALQAGGTTDVAAIAYALTPGR
jgi:predicted amidophosphoribosyltransferase